MEKKFTGKLSIGHFTGGPAGNGIMVTIQDEPSGVQFFRGELSVADFASCIMGHREVEIKFDLAGLKRVGTLYEHKTEKVPFKRTFSKREIAEIEKALAPYEVDGWRGDRDDLTNGHRSNGDGTQSVIFRRHVDPVTKQPVL